MTIIVCGPPGSAIQPSTELVEFRDVSATLLDLETRIQMWPQHWPAGRIVKALRLIRHQQEWFEGSKS